MSLENTQEINAQCPKCFTMCNDKDVDYDSKHCKICKPKTPADRLAEELEKFENGAQRYDSSSTFHAALNSLAHGLGVYAVLDNTLKRVEILHRVNLELSAMEIKKKSDALRSENAGLKEQNKILTERLKKYESI